MARIQKLFNVLNASLISCGTMFFLKAAIIPARKYSISSCLVTNFNEGKMFSSRKIFQIFCLVMKKRSLSTSNISTKQSFWEPDYLKLARSKFPEYDAINVQIKGYDCAILENYQSIIHSFANQMELDVTDSWAQQLKKYQVTKLKPNSEVTECEYILNCYERNIKISKVYSYQMSIFLELIMTACPPTVNIKVQPYDPILEEIRYVPDYKILELKGQLNEINKPQTSKHNTLT